MTAFQKAKLLPIFIVGWAKNIGNLNFILTFVSGPRNFKFLSLRILMGMEIIGSKGNTPLRVEGVFDKETE